MSDPSTAPQPPASLPAGSDAARAVPSDAGRRREEARAFQEAARDGADSDEIAADDAGGEVLAERLAKDG